MKLRINSKTLNRHFKEDALNIHYIIQMHQHTHCDSPKEFYRGKSAQIPASSQHSQPNMEYCSIPTSIIQSCSPFTVGASQEPIRLVVERKLEKVWLRVIEPAFPFHVPLSLALFLTHRHTYAYANTHFQRHTHMQGTRKRVALGDRGLGERRMLAVKGPDPSFGNVEPLTLL